MTTMTKVLYIVFLFAFTIGVAHSEIHRAKTLRGKSATKTGQRYLQDQDLIRSADQSKFSHNSETWLYSIISAILVGLSGIFPLLVIPIEAGKSLKRGAAAARLKLLLSFAVGGLLGDVFLHLLPEAWKHVETGDHYSHMYIGLWVLGGIFTFLVIEKVFPDEANDGDDDDDIEEEGYSTQMTLSHTPYTEVNKSHVNGAVLTNGNAHHRPSKKKSANQRNGVAPNLKETQGRKAHGRTAPQNSGQHNGRAHANGKPEANGRAQQNGGLHTKKRQVSAPQRTSSKIKTSGWLNLVANIVDNFTHGLAVAGSYCAGTKSGVLTTVIILLHEIPHEVGDFAILLRSGFDRWDAAKAQLLTATGGLLGALVALGAESASSAGDAVAWILPFTSGGFIYIALVSVVPELLKETNSRESLKQVIALVSGIVAMAIVALYLDEHNLPELDWFKST